MAISASFKQQCPSCETMVLIKDPKLVGKKVDCPKCKYRFVVEDPVARDKQAVKAGAKGAKSAPVEDEEDLEEAEDADDEAPPRKTAPAKKDAVTDKARKGKG